MASPDHNVYEHDFQALLTRNETYLQAIQRGGISLYNLGFKDYELQSIQLPHPSLMRSLRPIIPTEDQADLLEYIDDSLHRNGVFSPEGRKRPTSSKLSRSKSATPRLVTGNTTLPIKKGTSYQALLEKPKVAKNKLDCARPIKRTEDQLQREREIVAEIEKEKKLKDKLGKRFDLVDEKGEPFLYDTHGRKISVKEYEHRVEEERSKLRTPPRSGNLKFTGAIIEKTSKYVEHIRRLANEKKITWEPNKLPSSTLKLEEMQEEEVLPLDLIRPWPEYRLLEEGDVMLTIEHCRFCEEHNWITHHNEAKYLQVATSVQSAVKDFASKYAVRFFSAFKPIEIEDALQKSLAQSTGMSKSGPSCCAFTIDVPNRVGAMEVQLAVKTKKGMITHVLHSKLFRGAWPNIPQVLRRMEKIFGQSKLKLMSSPEDGDEDAANEIVRKLEKKMAFKRSASNKSFLKQKPKEVEEEETNVIPEFDNRQFAAESEPQESDSPPTLMEEVQQPLQVQHIHQQQVDSPTYIQPRLGESSIFSESLPNNSMTDAYDNLVDGSVSKVEEPEPAPKVVPAPVSEPTSSEPVIEPVVTSTQIKQEEAPSNDAASPEATPSEKQNSTAVNPASTAVIEAPAVEIVPSVNQQAPPVSEPTPVAAIPAPVESGSQLEAKSSVLYEEDDFCEASGSTQLKPIEATAPQEENKDAVKIEPAKSMSIDTDTDVIVPLAFQAPENNSQKFLKSRFPSDNNMAADDTRSPAIRVRDEGRRTILDIKAMFDEEVGSNEPDSKNRATDGTHDDNFWNEIDAAVFGDEMGEI